MASVASTPRMGEPSDEKAKKVRTLLSSYYSEPRDDGEVEVGSSSNAVAGAISTGLPVRPLSKPSAARMKDIDSPYFNADEHLKRVLKETRLDSLTDAHRNVVTEVGSLDSDMQMLGKLHVSDR